MEKQTKNTERKNVYLNLYSDNVYCYYGTDSGAILNGEIASTIEERANNHKIKEKLSINFKTYKEAPINQEEFVNAYHNTFSSKIKTKQHELKRCLITGIILLLIGLVMLCFDVFIENKVPYFWFEFFNVFSWVFCWGAIEVLTIQLVQIKMEINKLKKITNANLLFTSTSLHTTKETNKKSTRKGTKSAPSAESNE